MDRVTQEQVLLVYMKCCNEYLTSDIVAGRLGTQENAVRASISWLIIGGYLTCSQKHTIRLTRRGDVYRVKSYKWSGKKDPITHVRQNPEERRKATDQTAHCQLQYAMYGWVK
jgi:hypothetical protein